MSGVPRMAEAGQFPDWRFETLDIHFDAETSSLWASFKADSPHCYTLRVLKDAIEFRDALQEFYRREGACLPLRYLVVASKKPNVFSLGGDLATFARCIREKDRAALLEYAYACIEVMHTLSSAFDLPIITLSVVRGQCMGGGFEGALATDFIIAEEDARLGVPEIAFNTFPGMGAVSFLLRRVGSARAQELLTTGRVYTPRELHEIDLVDVVAPAGKAFEIARAWMRDGGEEKWRRRQALVQMRKQFYPVSKDELLRIVELWTDCSLSITEHDLRYMERLVSAQRRLSGGAPTEARKGASLQ